MLRKIFIFFLIFAFVLTLPGPVPQAGVGALSLPVPGTMVNLSSPFAPAVLTGIKVNPENPLEFDFLVQPGDQALSNPQKQEEYLKLVKYFMAALTTPGKDMWVNLSPYEGNRIIPQDFGATEVGRDLLAQDYILKQLTASLIYPEKELGRKFWDRVYSRAQKELGTTNIPVKTFNKVWIVPQKAVVYEHNHTAIITESHLKVMLEEDYLAIEKNQRQPGDMFPAKRGTCPQSGCQANERLNVKAPQGNHQLTIGIGSQVTRQIILPELEKEVNQGQNFAPLRQIYHAVILSSWFKKRLKESILGHIYLNKEKVKGIERSQQEISPEQIFKQYLKAYKKGVFNYIREESSIPRKYFSGGAPIGVTEDILQTITGQVPSSVEQAMTTPLDEVNIAFDVHNRAMLTEGDLENLLQSTNLNADLDELIKPYRTSATEAREAAIVLLDYLIKHPELSEVYQTVLLARMNSLASRARTLGEWEDNPQRLAMLILKLFLLISRESQKQEGRQLTGIQLAWKVGELLNLEPPFNTSAFRIKIFKSRLRGSLKGLVSKYFHKSDLKIFDEFCDYLVYEKNGAPAVAPSAGVQMFNSTVRVIIIASLLVIFFNVGVIVKDKIRTRNIEKKSQLVDNLQTRIKNLAKEMAVAATPSSRTEVMSQTNSIRDVYDYDEAVKKVKIMNNLVAFENLDLTRPKTDVLTVIQLIELRQLNRLIELLKTMEQTEQVVALRKKAEQENGDLQGQIRTLEEMIRIDLEHYAARLKASHGLSVGDREYLEAFLGFLEAEFGPDGMKFASKELTELEGMSKLGDVIDSLIKNILNAFSKFKGTIPVSDLKSVVKIGARYIGDMENILKARESYGKASEDFHQPTVVFVLPPASLLEKSLDLFKLENLAAVTKQVDLTGQNLRKGKTASAKPTKQVLAAFEDFQAKVDKQVGDLDGQIRVNEGALRADLRQYIGDLNKSAHEPGFPQSKAYLRITLIPFKEQLGPQGRQALKEELAALDAIANGTNSQAMLTEVELDHILSKDPKLYKRSLDLLLAPYREDTITAREAAGSILTYVSSHPELSPAFLTALLDQVSILSRMADGLGVWGDDPQRQAKLIKQLFLFVLREGGKDFSVERGGLQVVELLNFQRSSDMTPPKASQKYANQLGKALMRLKATDLDEHQASFFNEFLEMFRFEAEDSETLQPANNRLRNILWNTVGVFSLVVIVAITSFVVSYLMSPQYKYDMELKQRGSDMNEFLIERSGFETMVNKYDRFKDYYSLKTQSRIESLIAQRDKDMAKYQEAGAGFIGIGRSLKDEALQTVADGDLLLAKKIRDLEDANKLIDLMQATDTENLPSEFASDRVLRAIAELKEQTIPENNRRIGYFRGFIGADLELYRRGLELNAAKAQHNRAYVGAMVDALQFVLGPEQSAFLSAPFDQLMAATKQNLRVSSTGQKSQAMLSTQNLDDLLNLNQQANVYGRNLHNLFEPYEGNKFQIREVISVALSYLAVRPQFSFRSILIGETMALVGSVDGLGQWGGDIQEETQLITNLISLTLKAYPGKTGDQVAGEVLSLLNYTPSRFESEKSSAVYLINLGNSLRTLDNPEKGTKDSKRFNQARAFLTKQFSPNGMQSLIKQFFPNGIGEVVHSMVGILLTGVMVLSVLFLLSLTNNDSVRERYKMKEDQRKAEIDRIVEETKKQDFLLVWNLWDEVRDLCLPSTVSQLDRLESEFFQHQNTGWYILPTNTPLEMKVDNLGLANRIFYLRLTNRLIAGMRVVSQEIKGKAFVPDLGKNLRKIAELNNLSKENDAQILEYQRFILADLDLYIDALSQLDPFMQHESREYVGKFVEAFKAAVGDQDPLFQSEQLQELNVFANGSTATLSEGPKRSKAMLTIAYLDFLSSQNPRFFEERLDAIQNKYEGSESEARWAAIMILNYMVDNPYLDKDFEEALSSRFLYLAYLAKGLAGPKIDPYKQAGLIQQVREWVINEGDGQLSSEQIERKVHELLYFRNYFPKSTESRMKRFSKALLFAIIIIAVLGLIATNTHIKKFIAASSQGKHSKAMLSTSSINLTLNEESLDEIFSQSNANYPDILKIALDMLRQKYSENGKSAQNGIMLISDYIKKRPQLSRNHQEALESLSNSLRKIIPKESENRSSKNYEDHMLFIDKWSKRLLPILAMLLIAMEVYDHRNESKISPNNPIVQIQGQQSKGMMTQSYGGIDMNDQLGTIDFQGQKVDFTVLPSFAWLLKEPIKGFKPRIKGRIQTGTWITLPFFSELRSVSH